MSFSRRARSPHSVILYANSTYFRAKNNVRLSPAKNLSSAFSRQKNESIPWLALAAGESAEKASHTAPDASLSLENPRQSSSGGQAVSYYYYDRSEAHPRIWIKLESGEGGGGGGY